MTEEGYKPSEEEIELAKSHMRSAEGVMSTSRELQFNNLAEMGVKGYLYFSHTLVGDHVEYEFEGELNGHRVLFKTEGKQLFIDGVEVDKNRAMRFKEKYCPLAIDKSAENSYNDYARVEREKPIELIRAEEFLDEIL
ncbi:MAG: hypothetical protein WAX44_02330 [Minisyncoccia bacterium]